MRMIEMKEQTELTVKNIVGFFEKEVTPFGNGAKVDCPKKYIGKKTYLVILGD